MPKLEVSIARAKGSSQPARFSHTTCVSIEKKEDHQPFQKKKKKGHLRLLVRVVRIGPAPEPFRTVCVWLRSTERRGEDQKDDGSYWGNFSNGRDREESLTACWGHYRSFQKKKGKISKREIHQQPYSLQPQNKPAAAIQRENNDVCVWLLAGIYELLPETGRRDLHHDNPEGRCVLKNTTCTYEREFIFTDVGFSQPGGGFFFCSCKRLESKTSPQPSGLS